MVWRNTKTLKWPHFSFYSCGVSALRLAGSKYPANWFHQLIQVPCQGSQGNHEEEHDDSTTSSKKGVPASSNNHVMIMVMFLIVIPSGIVELMWNASKEIGLPDFTRNPCGEQQRHHNRQQILHWCCYVPPRFRLSEGMVDQRPGTALGKPIQISAILVTWFQTSHGATLWIDICIFGLPSQLA